MKKSQESLPQYFRDILWSYQFEDIDPHAQKNSIIVQTINYGTLQHWRWIVQAYGKNEVRQILMTIPVTSVRRHVRKLVSLIFHLQDEEFNNASRGTH